VDPVGGTCNTTEPSTAPQVTYANSGADAFVITVTQQGSFFGPTALTCTGSGSRSSVLNNGLSSEVFDRFSSSLVQATADCKLRGVDVNDVPITVTFSAQRSYSPSAGISGNAGFLSGSENRVTGVGSVFDTTPPAPVISGLASTVGLTADQVTIDFGETVTGFDLTDLTVVNLVASNLQQGGTDGLYTFDVVATGNGAGSISLPADAVDDLGGNGNTAAAEVTTTADIIAPTVMISGVPDGFTGPVTATITFDWNEDVLEFADGDITVTGGTLAAISGGPSVWTAELSVDGNADVVVSVAADAVQDASGTPSAAASVTGAFASGEAASQLIATFMEARAAALLASQPDVRGFLGGTSTGLAFVDVTQGAGTVRLRTGGSGPFWAALDANWSDLGSASSSYALATLGAHTWLSQDALLGGMLQYDMAETRDGAARIEGTGWLIGPYFAAELAQGEIVMDGRLLYGRTDNEISPLGTYVDSFETERWLAILNTSGRVELARLTLLPGLGYAYTEDRQMAYVDALSVPVPEQTISLGELTARLEWEVPLGDGATVFTGGIAGIRANSSQTSSQLEGGRGRFNLGLRHAGANGFNVDLGGYIDGIGAANYQSRAIALTVSYAF
jgi:hypothetical protein